MLPVDWTHGAAHMWDNHGVSVPEATEAICDVEAVLFDPDPKSTSGRSARLLGYSHTRRRVLVVILVHRDDGSVGWWGANGWDANSSDADIYWRGQSK